MKKRSSKRARLENNRWSVFTDDLNTCYFCGGRAVAKHEILYGSNRNNSMEQGFVLPLCRLHHNSFHKNHVLTNEWSRKCQTIFELDHSNEEWLKLFHKNYK